MAHIILSDEEREWLDDRLRYEICKWNGPCFDGARSTLLLANIEVEKLKYYNRMMEDNNYFMGEWGYLVSNIINMFVVKFGKTITLAAFKECFFEIFFKIHLDYI